MSEFGVKENAAHGITTILFDLDNTLISTREADAAACNKVASWLENRGMSKEKSLVVTKNYLHKFREAPAPDHPTDQDGLDTWRRDVWKSVLPQKYEHLDSVYSVWKGERMKHLHLKPCVKQLLEHLATHFNIGLITNGPSVAQWEKVMETGCHKYCGSIVISKDHNVEKPDKAIFDIVCGELQVKPCECIMVGDKIETDIEGGKNAGMKITVWVNARGKIAPRDIQPDFTIQSVTDLYAVFRDLPLVFEG